MRHFVILVFVCGLMIAFASAG